MRRTHIDHILNGLSLCHTSPCGAKLSEQLQPRAATLICAKRGTDVRIDASDGSAYHSHMNDTNNTQPTGDQVNESPDPLTVGELRPLKELAQGFPLTYESLRKYAQTGRLRAVKFGNMWASTHAAVELYLASRDTESIPKKHRDKT